MKILILLLIPLIKADQLRQTENFQYTRCSDNDEKKGLYASQTGNTDGNYELTHNMDELANDQMQKLKDKVKVHFENHATGTGNVRVSAFAYETNQMNNPYSDLFSNKTYSQNKYNTTSNEQIIKTSTQYRKELNFQGNTGNVDQSPVYNDTRYKTQNIREIFDAPYNYTIPNRAQQVGRANLRYYQTLNNKKDDAELNDSNIETKYSDERVQVSHEQPRRPVSPQNPSCCNPVIRNPGLSTSNSCRCRYYRYRETNGKLRENMPPTHWIYNQNRVITQSNYYPIRIHRTGSNTGQNNVVCFYGSCLNTPQQNQGTTPEKLREQSIKTN